MKRKLLITLIPVIALFFMFGVRAVAESSERSYIIASEGEGGYGLYVTAHGQSAIVGESESVGELISLVSAPATIMIDGIETEEKIEFPAGELVITGAISFSGSGGMSISEGTFIRLCDVSISFLDGAVGNIRVKGGGLEIGKGASVRSASYTPIVSDFSADATLVVNGGSVECVAATAINARLGSVRLLGGEVKSSGGSAILNSATLTVAGTSLSGADFDIETSVPIRACYGGKYNEEPIRLKYLGEFPRGSMTELVYNTNAECTRKITVYDSSGAAFLHTFFESSEFSSEKSFSAVYLPYTVSFYDKTELIGELELLSGMCPKAIEYNAPNGYTVLGWYQDEELTRAYDFSAPIFESTTLYLKKSLAPPEFSVSSLSFTYDGGEHTFGLDSLTHPLSENGFFGFSWYKNGEHISSARELNISTVSDSGEYYCKVKFSYNGDFSEITTPSVSVTVEKQSVKIPTIAPKTYTGYELYADVPPSRYYTAERTFGISADSYPVSISLTDFENYRWENNAGATITAEFAIIPAKNEWYEYPSVSSCYVGAPLSVGAKAAFGEVKFLYSNLPDGIYSERMPTAVGDYYLVCEVVGCDNYSALVSEPIPFSLLAESVSGLYVEAMPDKLTYTAFESFIGAGITVVADYNSGRRERVGIEALSVAYQSADSFRYGDSSVTLGYGGIFISLPVTVKRAEYDVSTVVFSGGSLIFDGSYRTLGFTGALPTGLDGIPLCATVHGGGSAVGEYTLSLVFSSKSENYKTPEPLNATLRILPLEVEVSFENTEFVYNGKPQLPVAYFINENGVSVWLSLSGAKISAGNGYVATAISPSANYKLKRESVVFNIKKADYDMSDAVLSQSEFVYDGGEKRVTLTGLPQGVSVIGYSDSSAIDAGSYTASVILSYDRENYNEPKLPKLTWRILPCHYDMSGVAFLDKVAVFDGNIHYPEIVGTLPVGYDGIPLSVSFSCGARQVTDEAVSVAITFNTESKNYIVPETVYRTVRLTPMKISVTWDGVVTVYNGKPQAPSAYSEYTAISVFGSMINAGEYTAVAVSESKNYEIVNAERSFVIKKCENRWLSEPSIEDIYEGGEISFCANALSGDVYLRYYADIELSREIGMPTECGIYYAVAYSDGGENYTGISSEAMRFEIIKLVATKIEATLKRDSFTAFEELDTGDFVIKVTYNDGSVGVADGVLVGIIYQNADSLRASDISVKFSYLSLYCESAVSVSRADYDMSGVRTLNSVREYNGTEQRIGIAGLPRGVSVRKIVGGVGTAAGRYQATVYFDYDRENYNEPTPMVCELLINKRVLGIPSLDTLTYNGEPQLPSLPEEIIIAEGVSQTNAGRYTLALTLRDTDNFVFSNGKSTAVCDFVIGAAELTVTVEDVKLYLFESFKAPAYTVDGLIASESIPLELYELDGKVCVRSDSPNYRISVVGGEVERVYYPSKDLTKTVLICTLLFAILSLFAFFVISHRGELTDYIKKKRAFVAYRTEDMSAERERCPQPLLALPDGSGEYSSMLGVDMPKADSLISDTMAKNLIKRSYDTVTTSGHKKAIINIGTISTAFSPDEYVDINRLKEKKLIGEDVGYIKVLADGYIDKPLFVRANSFSLSAVKMIALTGGEAVKVGTSQAGRRRKKYGASTF